MHRLFFLIICVSKFKMADYLGDIKFIGVTPHFTTVWLSSMPSPEIQTKIQRPHQPLLPPFNPSLNPASTFIV